MRFRTLENRVYRLLRDPAAATIAERPTTPWQPSALAGETYCLLRSFRAGGAPVATPVWFAVDAERVYLRSERRDAKVARVRRNPEVLIAACNARGRPTGPPMRGRARVLQTAQEEAKAEH